MQPYNNLSGKQKLIRTLVMLPVVIVLVWFFWTIIQKPKFKIATVILVIVWIWQFVSNIIDIINGR